ncbi:unnamed protein product, partial [Allacma fusca]
MMWMCYFACVLLLGTSAVLATSEPPKEYPSDNCGLVRGNTTLSDPRYDFHIIGKDYDNLP